MSDANLHPVHDSSTAPPEPGIALCLSGGGYRAMLFHVGCLWRLNQLGLLGRLNRISSVSGGSITAGVLGLSLIRWRLPRWVVASWNVLGFVLLVNIVTVAIVSTPMFGWFGADRLNTFVTYFPFVWLPAVLVTAALMGHVLVWRWLSSGRPR